MRPGPRKSTPEVKSGRVQKKNDWSLTPNYYSHRQPEVVIDRKRPGPGYRHLLRKQDIRDFIGILPEWPMLSQGLDAIVLAPGTDGVAGYHIPGVVHVCAWDEDLWIDYKRETPFFREHERVFRRLGVPIQFSDDGYALCQFTEETARAYQLLHILLHELGHHYDRITSRSQHRASRGERFAERYALHHEARIWETYCERFGLEAVTPNRA